MSMSYQGQIKRNKFPVYILTLVLFISYRIVCLPQKVFFLSYKIINFLLVVSALSPNLPFRGNLVQTSSRQRSTVFRITNKGILIQFFFGHFVDYIS